MISVESSLLHIQDTITFSSIQDIFREIVSLKEDMDPSLFSALLPKTKSVDRYDFPVDRSQIFLYT